MTGWDQPGQDRGDQPPTFRRNGGEALHVGRKSRSRIRAATCDRETRLAGPWTTGRARRSKTGGETQQRRGMRWWEAQTDLLCEKANVIRAEQSTTPDEVSETPISSTKSPSESSSSSQT